MITDRLKVLHTHHIVLIIIAGIFWLWFNPSLGLGMGIVGFMWFLIAILNTCEDDTNAQNNSSGSVGV